MPCYAVLWELLSNATWTPPLAEVLSSIFLYIELPGLGQGLRSHVVRLSGRWLAQDLVFQNGRPAPRSATVIV